MNPLAWDAAGVTLMSQEGQRLAINPPRAELRRYPRARVAWKVIIETPGSRPRMRKTVDISPFGVKVRFEERLPPGAPARLRFSVPDRRPLQLNSIVWRTDPDGPVFVFVGISEEELTRMKGLVDLYRGAA
jgi:PilZ domain-containing protein